MACVAFDFDQKQMAAACGSSVQLYDLTTGKVCTRWVIPQSRSVRACLALSRVASFGGCVAHQATAMRFKTPVLRVAYSPHKTKTLLSADGSGTVCVLDTKAFRVVKRFSHVHPGGATCVAFSRVPQPQRFFSCGADGTAVMYSECVARPCVIAVCWLRSCPHPPLPRSDAPVVVDVGTPCTCVDAMPDGTSALVGDETGACCARQNHGVVHLLIAVMCSQERSTTSTLARRTRRCGLRLALAALLCCARALLSLYVTICVLGSFYLACGGACGAGGAGAGALLLRSLR